MGMAETGAVNFNLEFKLPIVHSKNLCSVNILIFDNNAYGKRVSKGFRQYE
jgi:hypothetical protein